MADHDHDTHAHGHEAALEPEAPEAHATRRAVLQAAIGMGAGAAVLSTLYVGAGLIPKKEITPDREPIAQGDVLVYSQGPKRGQPINPAELKPGAEMIVAYPMNPESQVVKGAELKNTLLVMKLDPATLDAETAKLAAEGVVVYSGVCKHLGCVVSNWVADKQLMLCPCHGAQYDPKESGKALIVAPKPLGQFPIKLENNRIVIAGEPTRPIGVEAATDDGIRRV